MSLHDLRFTDIDNNTIEMETFKGKVLLIVNTASRCGFTKQYEDLQSLHEKYKDEGLVVIGFPCNQFNSQEPGTNEQIKDFCSTTYGVNFLMSEKIDVRGDNAHPIYKALTEAVGRDVPWNFDKFIVDRLGKIYGLSPDETSATFEPFIKSLIGFSV
jgi:glutathione peroxidase